ncbi:IS481 family transposase [Desulfocurvibacter africanus]
MLGFSWSDIQGRAFARRRLKNAGKKIARQRLSMLQRAEALGKVTKACKQRGMHKSQFYEYRRRFLKHGMVGLIDLPPIHRSHPMTTSTEVVERILELSLAHPAWGCVRLSDHLKFEGISISSPTVQNILIKNGMASYYDRWLKIEEKRAGERIELTDEQVAFIVKQSPAFKERHVESSRPGELLCQDTFLVGTLKGIGRVYMHTVVDTFSSYAFGFLHTTRSPEAAVSVLHNDVLPFYGEKGIPIASVLTDNGREYCGTQAHPYQVYLELNGIEHRRTKVCRPQSNGFVERFNQTVLDEFYRQAFQTKLYETVEALQADLDAWLRYNNEQRPHQGYRNMGRRPITPSTSTSYQSGKKLC